MLKSIGGVFPPIPTPFDASGSIDLAALSGNLRWWNAHEFAGIVILGSNGEAVHLSEAEKLELVRRVRDETQSDRLVMAGAGLHGTDSTIDLTKRVADAGADVALILPPSYYRGLMDGATLAEHFEAVADASPIPLILYNMPANTGIDMQADLIGELAKHDNIAGLKDSSGNVARLAELRGRVDPGFALLAGSAGFLLPALAVGADGGVLALSNIAPSVCLEIYRLAKAGAWAEARALQNRVVRANRAVTRGWGVPALKAAMEMIGLVGGLPRPPLRPFPDELKDELRLILDEAGLMPPKETG